MTETKSLKDAQQQVWRFGRNGVGWNLGMKPDIDPQNLPFESPYLLINMRTEGGVPSMRPGRVGVCDSTDAVSGLWDHQIGTARSLYIVGDGCPGISPTVGSFVGRYDAELRTPTVTPGVTAPYENVAYFNTTSADVVMGKFSQQLYFGVDATIQRKGEVQRLALPSGYTHVSAFMEHEGDLLCALANGATSAIFKFDGTTFSSDLAAINPVVGFFRYRDMCGAVFNGTPNSIRVRTAAGVWGAAIPPSAGTVKVVGPDNCASYKDKAYIPDGDTDIFSFDQTSTLTRIPIATNLIDAGGHIMAVTTAFGYLYYVWHNLALDAVFIGRFDGTTWTPKHKSLTAQGGWSKTPRQARVMKPYAGSLVVGCTTEDTAVFSTAIYISPREATSGTWTINVPAATSPSLDMRQFLVF